MADITKRIMRRDAQNGGKEWIVYDQYGDEHKFSQLTDAHRAIYTKKYFVTKPKNPKARPAPVIEITKVKDKVEQLMSQLAEIEKKVIELRGDLIPEPPKPIGFWESIKRQFIRTKQSLK